jgi:hypothetical protein
VSLEPNANTDSIFDSAFMPWALVFLMVLSGVGGAFWLMAPS